MEVSLIMLLARGDESLYARWCSYLTMHATGSSLRIRNLKLNRSPPEIVALTIDSPGAWHNSRTCSSRKYFHPLARRDSSCCRQEAK